MSGFSRQWALLTTLLIGLLPIVSAPSHAQNFLGLPAGMARHEGFWEGKTDYGFALRPSGRIRAIMLFARFTDAKIEENPKDLYNRLAPGGMAFFTRASYGKVTLQIDSLPHWIPMDHPSTWPDYSTKAFESQKTYLEEAIQKAAKEIDFTPYDIVYVVGSQGPGSEYLAWQKRKLEWLTDSAFVIVPNGSADALIAPIYEKEGKKAVVAPISATEAYVAEVRSMDGQPESETGVLLYKVDLTAKREGHLRILPAAPDDNDPAKERRFITLYNALFHNGGVLDDKENHVRIEILGRTGKSFRLRITR